MDFEQHPDMLLITPAIGLTAGECDDPICDAKHWRLSITWLVWSLHFYL